MNRQNETKWDIHKFPIYRMFVCWDCFLQAGYFSDLLSDSYQCTSHILDILLIIQRKYHAKEFFDAVFVHAEILKVCSCGKKFLPSAALKLFCKKLLDRCTHIRTALRRDEYIWISQRAAEQIGEAGEAQETENENVRHEKSRQVDFFQDQIIQGGFLCQD